ncbi:NAD/NADP octopine/nopaline dehydrogenase family protein [Actinophytocola sp.]|uniref:NAD/NADP octopine/nopaline dehydrogenase family protein n=1 Tax=Actinophytocola sp. TaxID=1872138 RepID=UPI00389AEBCB
MTHARVTVLGAGDAGRALAGLAARAGAEVTVWNRGARRLADLRSGELTLLDPAGRAAVVRLRVEADLTVACADAGLVLLAVSSAEQAELVVRAWPHVRQARAVVLVPGHTGGVLAARHALGDAPGPALAEMPLPFVCRGTGPAEVQVRQHKTQVPVAVLPAAGTEDLAAALAALYPGVRAASGLWETGLGNVTAVSQPVLALTNLARIDRAEPFAIYTDGVSPAVGRMIEALDRERLALADALGVRVPGVLAWFHRVYGTAADTVAGCFADAPGYAGIAAPTSVRHRFLAEHVRTGAVPMAALAQAAGSPHAVLDGLVELACAATGEDLRATGRTLAAMGFPDDATIADLRTTDRRFAELVGTATPAAKGAE